MRAVGYVRLSNLTEATTSPARQREQITAYCAARGWELVELVEDLGESGSRVGKGLERPGLARIRGAWDQYDVLVTAKLDRLARNVRDFATLAEDAQANGCALAVVAEGLDLSTPTGRFVATILAAFAEMEADQIRERIVAMRTDVRANHAGRYMGGTLPYGYRTAPRPEGGKTLVPDDAEAARVREAAARVLSGETLYGICQEWNTTGVLSKKGGKWSTVALHTVLTGYAVAGVQSHGGTPDRGDDGTLLSTFPPVLDRDTWGRVRGVLERSAAKPRARRPAQMLAGLARCVCGQPLYSRKQRNRPPLYVCNGRSVTGCKVGGVTAHNLDAEVERRLLESRGHYLVALRVERQTEDAGELADVEEAIRATTRRLAEDDDDTDDLARLVELKARRSTLRAQPETVTSVELLGNLSTYWRDAGTAERTDALRTWVEAIVVSPGQRHGGVFDPSRVEVLWTDAAPELDVEAERGATPVLLLGAAT